MNKPKPFATCTIDNTLHEWFAVDNVRIPTRIGKGKGVRYCWTPEGEHRRAIVSSVKEANSQLGELCALGFDVEWCPPREDDEDDD